MRTPVLIALLLSGGSCSIPATSLETRPPAPAEQRQAPDRRERPTTVSAAGDPGIPDPVVRRLQVSVESLVSDGDDLTPEQLARALHSMAAALELLPGATWARVEDVREAARRLTDGTGQPVPATRGIANALSSVARVLVGLERPSAHVSEFQRAVASLGESIDALDVTAPGPPERGALLRAFAIAADAILLAAGLERRFSGDPAPVIPGSPGALADRSAEVRSAVATLAGADSVFARSAASAALVSLAAAIESAPGQPGGGAELAAEVRFEAEKLLRSDPLAFGDASWIQLGLVAAVDSLEEMPSGRSPGMRTWLASARRAAQSIVGGRSLAFQRAAVQDAFRAVADALAVIAETCVCRPRGPREGQVMR